MDAKKMPWFKVDAGFNSGLTDFKMGLKKFPPAKTRGIN